MGRAIDRDRLDDLVPERFELLERLGAGAFGVVYRAFDDKHQTTVALKTLHQLEPRHLYHFKREFRSLAGISHPNLVDLYELVADDEIWFFTMSHIDGVDFRTAMRQGRLEDRVTESANSIDPEDETLIPTATPEASPDLAPTVDPASDSDRDATAQAATLDGLGDDGNADADGGSAGLDTNSSDDE
ncbi:MAG: protein kinase, partial [Bradymonadaceae bacterium]